MVITDTPKEKYVKNTLHRFSDLLHLQLNAITNTQQQGNGPASSSGLGDASRGSSKSSFRHKSLLGGASESMSEYEILQSLRTLQQVLVVMAAEMPVLITNELVMIGLKISPVFDAATKKTTNRALDLGKNLLGNRILKKPLSSSNGLDKGTLRISKTGAGTPAAAAASSLSQDSYDYNSPEYFVLETLLMCFKRIRNDLKLINLVSQIVLQFELTRLLPPYSLGVIKCSAEAIGILCVGDVHFKSLVDSICSRVNSVITGDVPTEDMQAFHLPLMHFVIGCSSESRVHVSQRFLECIRSAMNSLERTSAREDLGMLLQKFLLQLVRPDSYHFWKSISENVATQGWNAEHVQTFKTIYEDIYDGMNKWVKKKEKYGSPIISVMSTMVSSSDPHFYAMHAQAFLQLLSKSLKEQRAAGVAVIEQFFSSLAPAMARMHKDMLEEQALNLLSQLFAKKSSAVYTDTEEGLHLVDCVAAMGSLCTRPVGNKLVEYIRDKSTGSDVKWVSLQALAKMAPAVKDDKSFVENVSLCVSSLLLDAFTSSSLFSSILLCLPLYHECTADTKRLLIQRIVSLMYLNPAHATDTNSIVALSISELKACVSENPGLFFPAVVRSITEAMLTTRLFSDDDLLSTVFDGLTAMTRTLFFAYQHTPEKFGPEFQGEWWSIRPYLEGVCILLGLHGNLWVRLDAALLCQQIADSLLEKQIRPDRVPRTLLKPTTVTSDSPELSQSSMMLRDSSLDPLLHSMTQAAQTQNADERDQVWISRLMRIASEEWEVCASALMFAWRALLPMWNPFVDDPLSDDSHTSPQPPTASSFGINSNHSAAAAAGVQEREVSEEQIDAWRRRLHYLGAVIRGAELAIYSPLVNDAAGAEFILGSLSVIGNGGDLELEVFDTLANVHRSALNLVIASARKYFDDQRRRSNSSATSATYLRLEMMIYSMVGAKLDPLAVSQDSDCRRVLQSVYKVVLASSPTELRKYNLETLTYITRIYSVVASLRDTSIDVRGVIYFCAFVLRLADSFSPSDDPVAGTTPISQLANDPTTTSSASMGRVQSISDGSNINIHGGRIGNLNRVNTNATAYAECEVLALEAVKLLDIVLDRGPLHNADLETEVQQLLLSFASSSTLLFDRVALAHATLLRQNRAAHSAVVHYSLQRADSPNDSDHRVLALQSLVNCISRDGCQAWKEQFPVHRLVYAALLHATNKDHRCRLLASKIQCILAMQGEVPVCVNGSDSFAALSHPLLIIRREWLLNYSRECMRLRPDLLLPLLDECAQLQASIHPRDKSAIVTLLDPWIQNFPTEYQGSDVGQCFQHLYTITYHSIAHPVAEQPIMQVWESFMATRVELLTPLLDYLLECYKVSISATPRDQHGVDVVRNIVYAVACTTHTVAIVDHLVTKLRRVEFGETLFDENPRKFLELYKAARDVATESVLLGTPTDSEVYAFTLLSDLARVCPADMIPHLPLLLHNALVLFGPNPFSTTVQGEYARVPNAFIANILSTLCYGTNGMSSSPRLAYFITLFGGSERNSYTESAVTLEQITQRTGRTSQSAFGLVPASPSPPLQPANILELVDLLEGFLPSLREQWASLAFSWGLCLPSVSLSIESINVFEKLNRSYDIRVVRALVLGLFTSMRDAEGQKTEIVLELLTRWVKEQRIESTESYLLLCDVALSFVSSAHMDVFDVGLDFALAVLGTRRVDGDHLATAIGRMWKLDATPANFTMEETIVAVLLRGVCYWQTRQESVALLTAIAWSLGKREANSIDENGLVSVVMVFFAIQMMDGDHGKSASALTYLANSEYSKELDVFKPLFSRADDHDASLDTAKAFVNVFVNVFEAAETLLTVLEMLVGLLECVRDDKWVQPIVRLIQAFLENPKCPALPDQAFSLLLARILQTFYIEHGSTEQLSDAATLLGLLVRRAPPGLDEAAFNKIPEVKQAVYGLAVRASLPFCDGLLPLTDPVLEAFYSKVLKLTGNCAQETPLSRVGEIVPPQIFSVQPDSGPPLTWITVLGEHLGKFHDDVVSVEIGGKRCTELKWVNETELNCVVPHGLGTHVIVVDTVSGGTGQSTCEFTYASTLRKGSQLNMSVVDEKDTVAPLSRVKSKRSIAPHQRVVESRRLQVLRAAGAKERQSVFRVSISDENEVIKLDQLPPLVVACVEEIEKRGLEEEGVYRLSGSVKDVAAVLNAFNKKKTKKVNLQQWDDIHAICGAVKQYFREMPQPLLLFENYDSILDTKALEAEQLVSAVRRILLTLPLSNQALLYFLCRHLLKVVALQDRNKMSVRNICVVFGPSLIRPRQDDLTAFQNTPKLSAFLEVVLDKFDEVFDTSSFDV